MRPLFLLGGWLFLLSLFLAPVPMEALTLPEFVTRVQALKQQTPTLEANLYKLDGATEELVRQMGLIDRVETPSGSVNVHLGWVEAIAQDLLDETTASRRHLYWKSLLDTLEGLTNELALSPFGGSGHSIAEIMAALRDARQEVRPLRQCLVPGAGGGSEIPDAALDQYAELPENGEITAIRHESGSFSGYGSRNLDPGSSGSSGGFSPSTSPSSTSGQTSSHGSSGSSGSTSSPGTPVSYGSSAGSSPGYSPGTQPIPQPAGPTPHTTPPPPPPPPPKPSTPQLTGSAQYLYWILGTLVTLVVLVVAVLIYRAWARSRALATHKPLVLGTTAVEEEVRRRKNVDLYQQALEEARKGNYEMGVRLMALAILLLLDQRGRMNFDKARTNGEHRLRILDEHPALGKVMESPLRVFDRLYYGPTPASEPDFQEFRSVFEKLEKNLA